MKILLLCLLLCVGLPALAGCLFPAPQSGPGIDVERRQSTDTRQSPPVKENLPADPWAACSARLDAGTGVRIGVALLKAPAGNEELASKVRVRLVEALVTNGVTVVSRDLEPVLSELQSQRSAMFAAADRAEVGKLLGAQALVTGELSVSDGRWQASFALVEVASGRILATSALAIPQALTLAKTADQSPAYRRAQAAFAGGHWQQAIPDYGRAIQEHGEFAVYYFFRGLCHLRLQQTTSALADFTQAIALDGNTPTFYNYRGRAYHAGGQLDLAAADYARALALNPDYAYACSNLGNVHLARRQNEQALAWHRKAAALLPDDPLIWHNLACAYAQAGQHEQALDALRQAVRHGADKGQIAADEDLQPLHADPRFRALIEKGR